MEPDLWELYRHMLRSRLFEKKVAQLWEQGKISGEMHLGIGEEAIVAGIVLQLQEGDAMALDHRGTPPLLMRGVDPVLLLRELLGRSDGLCAGMGGHMHLFSPQHLAASSGIVGASGPAAAGFALAAQQLRPGSLALAFFGEGAMNQGMLMETLNLAAVWKLPVIFVCKNNQWAVSTHSPSTRGGNLLERALSFGIPAFDVDGSDVEAIWDTARECLQRARAGAGPSFLHARCVHLEGHFLGDPLLRMTRRPILEIRQRTGPLLRSLVRRQGAPVRERLESLSNISSIVIGVQRQTSGQGDPLRQTRRKLFTERDRLREVEKEAREDLRQIIQAALAPPAGEK